MNPIKFDMRITSSQRHYLIVALAQCKAQGYYGADENGRKEIDDLYDMLESNNMVPLVNPDIAHPDNVCNDMTE